MASLPPARSSGASSAEISVCIVVVILAQALTGPRGPAAARLHGSSRGAVAGQTREVALLQAMLDVEVALMRALAKAGIAPAQAATEVAQAADASTFDVAAIGKGTADKGTPVPAMLSALRSRLSADAA